MYSCVAIASKLRTYFNGQCSGYIVEFKLAIALIPAALYLEIQEVIIMRTCLLTVSVVNELMQYSYIP